MVISQTSALPPVVAQNPTAASVRSFAEAGLWNEARQWEACAGIVTRFDHGDDLSARRARLCVSFGKFSLPNPSWGVRFWEGREPDDVAPIEWLLISDAPVECMEDVLVMLDSAGIVAANLGCV